ncbi:ABC transporter permease [Granulicoccus phenolivorans]|uniref:ABC transporter permease n=1 Tax=Granulicoccus phenolivorans TaxID=266854 RepID=UPI0004081EC5|nr:ABC transporter permease subunit [Granulicoccus phenolivorans]
MDFTWIGNNLADIGANLGLHVILSVAPVLIALVISLPVGYLLHRTGRTANVWVALIGLLYAVPSVALFVAMPLLLGTQILDPINIVIALSAYGVALLVRSVVDGFRRVEESVRLSADAMGYGSVRRVLTVELPLAMPVVFSGLRVVTVSTISMVSVGAVIGNGALGQYFDLGFRQNFLTPVIVGIILIMALALLADGLILLTQRVTLPWYGLRTRQARSRGPRPTEVIV